MKFWKRNQEVDELKKENEQLKAFLKTDREEKCEAYLKQNPEGSILGLITKYPMVGEKILEQHYEKGELAKSFIDGLEQYKLTATKETIRRKITGNLGSDDTSLITKTTERAVTAEPLFRFLKKRKPKWNDKTKSKILQLRSEGKGYVEISKITGVPQGSISKIVLHAIAVKVTPSKKGKLKWAEKRKEVIRLRREGKTYAKIAKLTGVPKGSISALIPKSEKGYKTHKKVPKTELTKRELMVLNSIKLKDGQSPKELGISTGYGNVDVQRKVFTLRKKGYPIQTIWKAQPDGRKGRTGVYTLGKTTHTTPKTKTITGKQPPWEQVSDPTLKGKTIKEISKATGLTPTQIYNARWLAKKKGKLAKVARPIPRWKTVGELAKKGIDNKQIAKTLGLTSRQVINARWNAKQQGMEIQTDSRYTKVEVGATTPTPSTSKPKEESDYMKKARAEDKIDLKELCEKVGVDFYHYCDARRKIGFKSPYEYLLTSMLLSKSIRDNEAQQFLDIALKRAGLVLPEGLKRSICERAISFHKLPNIHPVMKQKVPEELESIGITFTDIEDFLSDFALKPELKLSDWKIFVRNFGELKEIDFRNSFDWLNNIIMQFFRRNQYAVKISFSGYDKIYYLKNWKRIKSRL